MTGFKRLVRGVGLVIAGTVSLALGLLLAERLVRPDVIEQINTPILLGLVLLFVLPALTFFAFRQDSRVVARIRDLSSPRVDVFAELDYPGSTPDIRAVRHEAHDRDNSGADRHHTAQPHTITAD